MDKDELLDIRAAILDALAFIETLRRGPDGEHDNGGHDRNRVERFLRGLIAAARGI